jgi:hypothetical protein
MVNPDNLSALEIYEDWREAMGSGREFLAAFMEGCLIKKVRGMASVKDFKLFIGYPNEARA